MFNVILARVLCYFLYNLFSPQPYKVVITHILMKEKTEAQLLDNRAGHFWR